MEQFINEIMDTKLNHLRRSCPRNITDLVFLEIEINYMRQYELGIKYKGADTINKYIGKYIRKYWGLKNLGRCNTPVSKLISSYEEHSN